MSATHLDNIQKIKTFVKDPRASVVFRDFDAIGVELVVTVDGIPILRASGLNIDEAAQLLVDRIARHEKLFEDRA